MFDSVCKNKSDIMLVYVWWFYAKKNDIFNW